MAVEDWIDELVGVTRSIPGVQAAPLVFKKDEFPESLSVFPTALTFVEEVAMLYPDGGPNQDAWSGTTEFHLVSDTSKRNLPKIMSYFKKIRTAFTANRLLLDVPGRSVFMKLRAENGPSIEVAVLQYGSEAPHLGLVVHWRVWERFS